MGYRKQETRNKGGSKRLMKQKKDKVQEMEDNIQRSEVREMGNRKGHEVMETNNKLWKKNKGNWTCQVSQN